MCGNNVKASIEECDDGNLVMTDGCRSNCTISAGWNCTGNPSICTFCGDWVKSASNELCDDGNSVSGDGCSSAC